MATLPSQNITLTADELRRKIRANGWPDKLSNCRTDGRVYIESVPGRGQTVQKVLSRYWDEDGTVIAVTILYKRADGERLSVRMLREGEIVYSASAVSGNPPNS